MPKRVEVRAALMAASIPSTAAPMVPIMPAKPAYMAGNILRRPPERPALMALAAAASGALRVPNTLFRVPPILTAIEEMSPNLPVMPSKRDCPRLHAVCARLPAASPSTPFRPSTSERA